MEGLLIILLLLACPLSMVVIGLGAWVIARLRGEKGELAAGSSGSHGERQQTVPGQDNNAGVSAQLSELERAVATLRGRVDATSGDDGAEPPGVDEKSSGASKKGNQRD